VDSYAQALGYLNTVGRRATRTTEGRKHRP
jgi:hypothetical protein